jgi:hypothetical protein
MNGALARTFSICDCGLLAVFLLVDPFWFDRQA